MAHALSRPRIYFRRTLLGLLLLSFVFFSTMVMLRINGRLHWQIVRNHSEAIFKYDIFQSQTIAFFSGMPERHHIAMDLINDSFFSPLYAQPGIDILKKNADDGYAPSQVAYGDIIAFNFPLDTNKKTAMDYYEMAAAQNYEPGRVKLEALKKH